MFLITLSNHDCPLYQFQSAKKPSLLSCLLFFRGIGLFGWQLQHAAAGVHMGRVSALGGDDVNFAPCQSHDEGTKRDTCGEQGVRRIQ